MFCPRQEETQSALYHVLSTVRTLSLCFFVHRPPSTPLKTTKDPHIRRYRYTHQINTRQLTIQFLKARVLHHLIFVFLRSFYQKCGQGWLPESASCSLVSLRHRPVTFKSQVVLCFLPRQQGCQIGVMLSSPIIAPNAAKSPRNYFDVVHTVLCFITTFSYDMVITGAMEDRQKSASCSSTIKLFFPFLRQNVDF